MNIKELKYEIDHLPGDYEVMIKKKECLGNGLVSVSHENKVFYIHDTEEDEYFLSYLKVR